MKKILLSLALIASTMCASAITLTEAFDKFAAIPGVAVTEMPDYDVAKEGLDWGKVVIITGQSVNYVKPIQDEITGEPVMETSIGGQPTVIYGEKTDDDKSLALTMTKAPMGVIIVFAQGSGDVVDTMMK